MAAGASSLFEKEIAEYLLKGTALKSITEGKAYLGFCEAETKKATEGSKWWETAKELKGTTGYKERLNINNAALKLAVTEQEGKLGESGKGATLKNSAEAKIFTAVPGTVTNPKVNFAFIARAASSAFEVGELLFMIPVSPMAEILSTTTEFSFATGELDFEVI